MRTLKNKFHETTTQLIFAAESISHKQDRKEERKSNETNKSEVSPCPSAP
jgi:hypothetical protein